MESVGMTVASLFLVISQIVNPAPRQFVSPVPLNYQVDYNKNKSALGIIKPRDKNAELVAVVGKALEGTTGKYNIVIKNLKNNSYFAQNENEQLHSASLYKTWLTAAVYEDIRDGKLDEDTVFTESIPGINNYFAIIPGDQELSAGTIKMTIKQLVEQTITISHNYTAMTLLKNIGGYDRVGKILTEFGMRNSTFNKTKLLTTPGDMALFLEKLYQHKVGDELISEKIIEVMARNKMNEGLPKYLPNGVKVAHKTGEIYDFKHDAGIIFAPTGDYIIVVMSQSTSPFGAEERIAQLSRAVYDYFSNP